MTTSLNKVENFKRFIHQNKNIEVIYFKTPINKFKKKFRSVSSFWKLFKNGLYSIGRISNREYFKELSGLYFQYENDEYFEMYIIYNSTKKKLNELQVILRIRKILNYPVECEFGELENFNERILSLIKSQWKIQTFGSYYHNKE